jgi:predicted Zn-dependent peptidase
LESILSVLEGLKKTTMSITELNKAKEQLKGNLLIDNESLVNFTKLQVKNLILSDYIWDLEKLLYKIDEIDTTDIRNLANQIFALDNLFLTILGTAKQTRLVEKLIQKFLAT